MDSVDQFQKAADSFHKAASSKFKMAGTSSFKMADNSSDVDSSDLDSDEEDEEAHFRSKPSYWNLSYGNSLGKAAIGSGGPFLLVDDKSQSSGRPRGKESDQSSVFGDDQSRFGGGSRDLWDPESMENEQTGFDDVQTILGRTNLIQSTTVSPESSGKTLSSDSLAFTLVYCSVFMVTLLYIGFRLARKWRRSGRGRAEEQHDTRHVHNHSGLTCNHAVCHQAAAASINTSGGNTAAAFPHVLPYTGLGALWIPEIMSMETGIPVHSVHSRGQCSAGCDSCQRLAQPPPSYTKLFLEEQPPTYSDAVVLETTVDETLATSSGGAAKLQALTLATSSGGAAKLQALTPTTVDGQTAVALQNIPTVRHTEPNVQQTEPNVQQQTVSITESEAESLLEASAPPDVETK